MSRKRKENAFHKRYAANPENYTTALYWSWEKKKQPMTITTMAPHMGENIIDRAMPAAMKIPVCLNYLVCVHMMNATALRGDTLRFLLWTLDFTTDYGRRLNGTKTRPVYGMWFRCAIRIDK